MSEITVTAIIPVHLGSVRLKRKALLQIEGHPMVAHVYFRAQAANCFDNLMIATGDDEIISVLREYNIPVHKTFLPHLNGTSRCSEAIQDIDTDVVCIVQGDEPLIDPDELRNFCNTIKRRTTFDAWNATCDLNLANQMNDLDVVKCIVNKCEEIIYMFRAGHLQSVSDTSLNYTKKIMGLIALKKDLLLNLAQTSASSLALDQNIEQLGIIDAGYRLSSIHMTKPSFSINTKEEAETVMEVIANDIEQQNNIRKLFSV